MAEVCSGCEQQLLTSCSRQVLEGMEGNGVICRGRVTVRTTCCSAARYLKECSGGTAEDARDPGQQ